MSINSLCCLRAYDVLAVGPRFGRSAPLAPSSPKFEISAPRTNSRIYGINGCSLLFNSLSVPAFGKVLIGLKILTICASLSRLSAPGISARSTRSTCSCAYHELTGAHFELKTLANEDTLVLWLLFGLRKLGNICCGHKMFRNKIRNIFCVPDTKFMSATNVVRERANGETVVSATMCPRLPRPLNWFMAFFFFFFFGFVFFWFG